MRWGDLVFGARIYSFEPLADSTAAGPPWAAIDDFTLTIMNGVATVHGHTYIPGAKLEVLRQIAQCEGVTTVRDCVTVRTAGR
jgi:hypothetical protein